ncbi:MAG TPA: FAD-binding oxidoreductase [Thermomicrobiales bacterium]|nr:FAD-binding oxidoreductase [Thermomicrobiales bacterium]
MKDYRGYSFWLETCGDDLTPRPPLDGSRDVDIAILGAGFTGLWTAYYLLSKEPSLKIAIVEAEIAGFGASGRNGGWCFSGFPVSPLSLLQSYGYDTARLVSLEMYKAVDEVGRVTREEGIDARYAKGGELEVARALYDVPKLQQTYDEFRAIGLEDHNQLLDARETQERINVAGAVGSFWNKEGAAIQPARLARGLARAVERLGGTIYEGTRVTDFTPAPDASLVTDRGTVHAKSVVLAGEAYLSALPKLSRSIIPLTSHMVVTEPLSDDQWDQIRWRERDVLGGFGVKGGYINHTSDGRIAFGAYRANYPYKSRITDDINLDEKVFAHAREATLDWFPMLQGVRFTHAWGGVFGVPRKRMPTMTYDPGTGIASAYGYSGEGVATANLSGRVLADLITETDSSLTTLPMTQSGDSKWEPEPLRWAGVTFVRRGRLRMLQKVEREGKYPEKPTLAQRLYNY